MRGRDKYKFMAAVAFMFLLPFLVLSMHFSRGYKELEKRDALARMSLQTRTAANDAAEALALYYDVSDLAASPGFLTASREGRKKILEDKIKADPRTFSEFAVLSVSGRETLRTGAASAGGAKDHSGTELFKKASSELVPAGVVEYGEYTPPVLVTLTPLFPAAGGKPEGFLLARMSLAYLGETVRATGRSSYGTLGLADAGGRLVSDSRGYSIIAPGTKAPGEALRAVNIASAKGIEDHSTGSVYMGRRCLVSVSRITGTRWWIFETVDASAPANHTYAFWVKRVILIGVILILAFSFASYRLALRWLLASPK